MGKKGKKKGASSAATKAEKEQKRAARLSLIDKHGRMPRDDGIRFYALLDFLAHIVSVVFHLVLLSCCHTILSTNTSNTQIMFDINIR